MSMIILFNSNKIIFNKKIFIVITKKLLYMQYQFLHNKLTKNSSNFHHGMHGLFHTQLFNLIKLIYYCT